MDAVALSYVCEIRPTGAINTSNNHSLWAPAWAASRDGELTKSANESSHSTSNHDLPLSENMLTFSVFYLLKPHRTKLSSHLYYGLTQAIIWRYLSFLFFRNMPQFRSILKIIFSDQIILLRIKRHRSIWLSDMIPVMILHMSFFLGAESCNLEWGGQPLRTAHAATTAPWHGTGTQIAQVDPLLLLRGQGWSEGSHSKGQKAKCLQICEWEPMRSPQRKRLWKQMPLCQPSAEQKQSLASAADLLF